MKTISEKLLTILTSAEKMSLAQDLYREAHDNKDDWECLLQCYELIWTLGARVCRALRHPDFRKTGKRRNKLAQPIFLPGDEPPTKELSSE